MKNRFDKKALVIFAVGVALIISGVLMLGSQNKEAKAATDYTVNWTVSKWANLSSRNDGEICSTGPSVWQVTGDVGGKRFIEQWTASDWKTDSLPSWLSLNTNGANFIGKAAASGGYYKQGGLGWCMRVYIDQEVGGHSLNPQESYYAIPSKWTVTGTIQ